MKLLFSIAVLMSQFYLPQAHAGDINWSGRYRAESIYVRNPSLESGNPSTTFLSQHLILSPEIVAADGLNIHTRFDIFNNPYSPNSQFGEFFGGAHGDTNNTGMTGNLPSAKLAVSDLYLTWTQQFGSFIAGRTPVQFGLGITYNAGNGEFDHWLDRRDLIGYKLVMGNFSFFPMYGKVKEGDPQLDDDVFDYMFQAQYENLDTDLTIGFFFDNRRADGSANDLSTTGVTLPNGSTGYLFNVPTQSAKGELDIKTYNMFVKKKNNAWTFAFEGSMQSGKTGLNVFGGANDGQAISLGGTALMGEISYKPEESKWNWDMKLGSVSGTDPNNQTRYNGYLVNKNYDVSLILFNYLLGDPSSSTFGNENYIRNTTLPQARKFDTAQITNALYLAPGFQWKWSDKWGMNGRFTWATLNHVQYVGQSKSLGEELDFGVYYNPLERFHIRFDTGYLMSGAAFKSDPTVPGNLSENKSIFAIMTRAVVNF